MYPVELSASISDAKTILDPNSCLVADFTYIYIYIYIYISPRARQGERRQRRHVVLQRLVGVGRDGGAVQVRDDDVVVQVHRRADPPRLCPVHHLHAPTCMQVLVLILK